MGGVTPYLCLQLGKAEGVHCRVWVGVRVGLRVGGLGSLVGRGFG